MPGRPEPNLDNLVTAAARGDESALATLYRLTSGRVLGLALKILRDRAAAEDTVCEVFTQIWQKAKEFDPYRGTAIAWILTMTRTRAIDRLRVIDRTSGREDWLDTTWDLKFAGPDPEQQTVEQERAQQVRHAIAALPAEQREAIMVSFYGGLSHSETAEALGAPLGTIKTRIRTGLASLRHTLASAEGYQA